MKAVRFTLHGDADVPAVEEVAGRALATRVSAGRLHARASREAAWMP
jgi:hypothetical protein